MRTDLGHQLWFNGQHYNVSCLCHFQIVLTGVDTVLRDQSVQFRSAWVTGIYTRRRVATANHTSNDALRHITRSDECYFTCRCHKLLILFVFQKLRYQCVPSWSRALWRCPGLRSCPMITCPPADALVAIVGMRLLTEQNCLAVARPLRTPVEWP